MNDNPIGLFDSGVGGLTILSQLTKHFPNENYVYFGDNARAPYGNKTEDQLFQINEEITHFLITQNIKMLIMACNTSCALFLDKLQATLPIPVIGLIRPASKAAIQISKNKKIAVLATTLTATKKAYTKAIQSIDAHCQIIEIACPELVPIVESGKIFYSSTFNIAKKYFNQALDFGADSFIYGCSHYPYLTPVFTKFTAKSLNFIDPAFTQIPYIKNVLSTQDLSADKRKKGQTTFWISGDINLFKSFLNRYNKNLEYSLNTYNL